MKPFYPISGVLAYYSPQKAAERGINWPEPPHVHFANLILDSRSLLAFDHRYGVLLAEHWEMTPEMRNIRLKVGDLTDEEKQLREKWQIAVYETDVTVAVDMQSRLRKAWEGEAHSVEVVQYGTSYHAQQEAYGRPRLTVAPSTNGIILDAKDLWSFIRIAFLLDYGRGITKVCGNPDCPAPYFLAKRNV